MPHEWEKQRDDFGFVHYLKTGTPGYFVKVEKTAGGDYMITAAHDDDCAGGDVDYKPDLRQAKRLAEALVDSGTWVEYTMDPEAAIKAAKR